MDTRTGLADRGLRPVGCLERRQPLAEGARCQVHLGTLEWPPGTHRVLDVSERGAYRELQGSREAAGDSFELQLEGRRGAVSLRVSPDAAHESR